MTSESGSTNAAEAWGPPTSGLAVRVRRTATRASVCEIAGDLDAETRAPVISALDGLTAERPSSIVVDLQHVAFCDSSGLNLLLQARMNAVAAGIDFRIARPSPAVARVFELTGTDAVFSIHLDDTAVPRPSG
ncbi:STAS domain-containing protein [Kitasatospora sp. NPDC051705]|uniref:STAS domain-containing protein n=1 Tax=Kitasatospora sp. NPDC051705 TaxID=3364057 RepID=UPI003788A7F8